MVHLAIYVAVELKPEKLAKTSKNENFICGILTGGVNRGMIGASNCKRERAYSHPCVCVVHLKLAFVQSTRNKNVFLENLVYS